MRSLIFIFTAVLMISGCGVANKDLYNNQASLAMKAATHEEAVKQYEASVEKGVLSGYFYAGRGDIHYHYGFYGRAVNDYTRAMRTKSDVNYNLKRGRSYLKLGFYKDAIIDFTSIIDRKRSRFPVAFVDRAKAYAAKGDYNSALKDLDKAKKHGGENRDFLKAMGELNYKMGRYDEAKLYAQKAIIGADNDSDLYLLRGKVFYKLKDANQAITDIKKALEIERGNIEAKRMLAWIYATNPLDAYRNGKESLRLSKELYEMNEDVQYAEVLAAAYAELDDFEKAVAVLEEAVRLTTDLVQREDFRFDIKNYEMRKKVRMW